jgi:hypothetical protein
MGHIHLSRLPATPSWNAVVNLLRVGAPARQVAAAATRAAENSLAHAASDPGLRAAFWLLAQLPLAARATNFVERLARLGMTTSSPPSLLELIAEFEQAIDVRIRKARVKTDLGQMAKLAGAETLTTVLSAELPGLINSTREEVRYALGKFAAPDHFAKLSRSFFASLINRNLEYFISRAIADHVGPGRGLRSMGDYADFRQALVRHCYEATLILEAPASEWYSNANWKGETTELGAAALAYATFRRLRNELRRTADDA